MEESINIYKNTDIYYNILVEKRLYWYSWYVYQLKFGFDKYSNDSKVATICIYFCIEFFKTVLIIFI